MKNFRSFKNKCLWRFFLGVVCEVGVGAHGYVTSCHQPSSSVQASINYCSRIVWGMLHHKKNEVLHHQLFFCNSLL